jgi:hypothetical protein
MTIVVNVRCETILPIASALLSIWASVSGNGPDGV